MDCVAKLPVLSSRHPGVQVKASNSLKTELSRNDTSTHGRLKSAMSPASSVPRIAIEFVWEGTGSGRFPLKHTLFNNRNWRAQPTKQKLLSLNARPGAANADPKRCSIGRFHLKLHSRFLIVLRSDEFVQRCQGSDRHRPDGGDP